MGDVVVSIDAELGWGYHDRDSPPARIDDARAGWHAALRLFEAYDLPATWAIVGHLMLDSCDGSHESHPLGPEWFSCPPGRATADDDWRAPDLVRAVLAAEQDHEVASHSFSHVVMDADGVTAEVAEAEAAAWVAAAEPFGIEPTSFVYPRNAVAHREVLADRGFDCYRGPLLQRWYDDSPLRPLWKLADWSALGTQPPIVTPTVDEYGLVELPPSFYLFSFEGRARAAARRLGSRPVVAVAKRGIDRAVDADGVFHMWFHPHNLLQPDGVERLDAVLDYLARRRAETDLEVRTMAGVAERVVEGGG